MSFWVTTDEIFSQQGGTPQALNITALQNMATVQVFQALTPHGLLREVDPLMQLVYRYDKLTPILVLAQGQKGKWLAGAEVIINKGDLQQTLVWYEHKARSQLCVVPTAWRWPSRMGCNGSGPSLLNMCSAWVYYELVHTVRVTDPPSVCSKLAALREIATGKLKTDVVFRGRCPKAGWAGMENCPARSAECGPLAWPAGNV